MGSARAERLWNPDDLLLTDSIRQVFQALSDPGGKQFALELLEGLAESKSRADLGPVNRVIAAWHRTMLFVQKPGFVERCERVQHGERGEGFTAGEIRDRLKHGIQDR